MKLNKYYNKKVNIEDNEGNTFVGIVNDYFHPDDNDNGKESIVIDLENGEAWEFYENDIKTIKEEG